MIAVINTLGPRLNKRQHPLGVCMAPSETELGRFIRARRLLADLSQKRLAKLTGIWQTQISMLERGERKYLDTWQITALANALQCDPGELKRRIPIKHIAEPTTELGRMVRERREQLKLTIEDFAKAMNMTVAQARTIELRHHQHISYAMVGPLAKVLKLKPGIFYKFLTEPGRPKLAKDKYRPMIKLGEAIATSRRKVIMSQPQLAKELGVKRQIVNQIEDGQYSFYRNEKMLFQITQILGIDFAKLQAIRLKAMEANKIRPGKKAQPRTPLGWFVFERRSLLGLTQCQVDQKMVAHKGTTAGIELGIRMITPDLIEKLSLALKCPIPTDLIPTNSSKSKHYRN